MFRGRERATIDPMQTNRKTFIALSVVLLAAALPAKSLRVLNLYGNPCAGGDGAAEGYRAAVTAALPDLVALDGTCLCARP
ncbi:MAG: hypothetical protein HOH65_03035, partial [Rhodospirillaceae bacterium]|nr:hypothetical protein [Rhodospirillaceae bacterium]